MTRADRAVTAAVLTLGAVVGLTAPWLKAPPPDRLWLVVWDLVVGLGFAAAGVAILPASTGWFSAGAALSLLAAPAVLAAGWFNGSVALWVGTITMPVPLALLRVIRRRPAARLSDALVLGTGFVATAGTAAGVPVWAGIGSIANVTVVLCLGWVLFESTRGDERRRLLWVVLGVCVVTPATALLLLDAAHPSAEHTLATGIVAAVLALALPLCASIAVLNPRIIDVREVGSRVSVLTVMATLTAAVYLGGGAAILTITGAPATGPQLLVVVFVVAAGFHPVMRRVRSVVDETLFGGRPDPIGTLSRLGTQLATGSTPPEWLETLRYALAVPGIELRQDGHAVAVSGQLDGHAIAVTPLRAGAEHVGDLAVALPADQLQVAPTTSAVLGLVAPPLAQALHADRLTQQLSASQGRVVTVLEEERRRMRRDLHDGLGPTLTGIAYSADAAANLTHTDPGEAHEILRRLRTDAADAIAEIRRIVYGLRPRALDELGLVGAVRAQTTRLRCADGGQLVVSFDVPAQLPDLPAAVEVVAYRVAVEALTNVARHAHVNEADLHLRVADGRLFLTVHNGADSGGDAWTPGVGIASMHERVGQIGGTLIVDRGIDGTTVMTEIPLSLVE
jgi:signal transduction histidine kinase